MGLPIIGDLIDGVTGIINKVVPDADKRNEINFQIQQLADQANQRVHDEMMGQIEVNKTEAGNSNVFVSGWRPFIGWVGGIGMAWSFILSPFLEVISRWIGWKGQMPVIDTASLMTLVLTMLGAQTLRSWDKKNGVATGNLSSASTPVYPPDQPGQPKSILPINIPWLK